jgi:hypothetical protein
MLLLLPGIAYCLIFGILRKKGLEWRQAALTAAVLCGTSVVLFTEVLSVPRLISRGPLAICWFALCVFCFFYWRTIKRTTPSVSLSSVVGDIVEDGSVVSPLDCPSLDRPPLDRPIRFLLVAAVAIIAIIAIIALVSAPNVWDAMEYHLPRATMWMSNHSVRFYPTPDYAQLIFGPWAEFAMMQTELLSGSDRFVNLVEFLSFVFSAIGVSFIARLLGAGPRGQALAAIACITIPEGILEASGPMNTYVVSFWIMTTVLFLMLWNEDSSWLNTICVGLAAGLAIFTKGSAYIILPFLVLACWWMGSPASRVRFLKRSAVFVVLILAINGPHYFRTYQLTGSPLGFPLPSKYPRLQVVVAHVGVRETIAGMLRNASLHVVTPSEHVNSGIDRAFYTAIWNLGVDPNDHGQVYLDDPFHSNHFSMHEIHAGNPLHFILIAVAIVVILWRCRHRTKDPALWYAVGLLLSLIFFSALLRWTPWSSRYQLPYFVVGAALIGVMLDRYLPRKAATAIAIVLVLSAVPFAVANRTRSLVPWSRVENLYHPREEQYFLDSHTSIAPANIAAARFINQLSCNRIAIDVNLDHPVLDYTPRSMFVYPLLAQIHADGRNRTVWYMAVQNDTVRYASTNTPCAVICFECARAQKKWDEYKSIGGRASIFDYIVVFSGEGETLNSGGTEPLAWKQSNLAR